MKRMCYRCAKYMGETDGNHENGVFRSVCDECRLRLDERLPDLLQAIATLRQQISSKKQNQTLRVLSSAQKEM